MQIRCDKVLGQQSTSKPFFNAVSHPLGASEPAQSSPIPQFPGRGEQQGIPCGKRPERNSTPKSWTSPWTSGPVCAGVAQGAPKPLELLENPKIQVGWGIPGSRALPSPTQTACEVSLSCSKKRKRVLREAPFIAN